MPPPPRSAGQRAVGAELVRDRTAVGRHQHPLLHSPAGYAHSASRARGEQAPPRVAGMLTRLSTQLNNAHPEGWRDRPCEAPATYRACMPVVNGEARDMVPSPARGQGDRWERWGRKSSPVTTATTHTTTPPSGFGHATGLSCRECGQVYELGPHYACEECFGPLEVGYDYPPADPVATSRPARRTCGGTRRCCRSRPTSPTGPPSSPATPG